MSTAPGTELDRTRRQFADLSGRLLQAIAGSAKYLPADEATLLRRVNPKVLAGAAVLLATWQYPSRAWSVLGELGDRIVPLWAQLDELAPYLLPLVQRAGPTREFAKGLQKLGMPLVVAILQSQGMQIWALALAEKFLPSSPGYSG